MPRRGCQLGVRDPQPLLLLPLLARAHRHNAILRTISVDTSDVLADESRLAPRAVKGPDNIRGDPAAVEFTRLRLHAFLTHVTGFHPAHIKSKMTTDCLIFRGRGLVAPSGLRRQFIAHTQRPVGSSSLELTKGATCARYEQVLPYVCPRDVVHGRMAGFEYTHRTICICDDLSSKLHPDSFRRRLGPGRTRVIPNRFLTHRTSSISAVRSG